LTETTPPPPYPQRPCVTSTPIARIFIYINEEDEEELDFGTESSDDEEKVEAVATPGFSNSKRKALNFIPKSLIPSKSKNIYSY